MKRYLNQLNRLVKLNGISKMVLLHVLILLELPILVLLYGVSELGELSSYLYNKVNELKFTFIKYPK